MLCLLPLKRLKRCGGLLGFSGESFELVFGVWFEPFSQRCVLGHRELPLMAFDKRLIEDSRLLSSLERAANEEGAVDC